MTLSRQIEQRVIDWLQTMDQQDVTVCREVNADKFPMPVVAVSVEIGEPINSVHRNTFNAELSVTVRVHEGDVGDVDQCEQITDDFELLLSNVEQGLENIPECLRYDFTGTSFSWDESVMQGQMKADLICRRII